MKRFLSFRHFKFDLLGGITAGIVALPLALAFGEQSGLGAASGLYGAAFISFFAALFGGTATQISGPTAPITALSMVVIAGLLQAHEGRYEEAVPVILMIFLIAGLIQIGLGMAQLGAFVKYIPYTVVSGFMTGIGVMILLTTMPVALGYYSHKDEHVVHEMKPLAEELILERILREEANDEILVLEEFNETVARARSITQEDIDLEARILAENDGRGVWGSLKYLPRAIRTFHWVELGLTLLTLVIIYGLQKLAKPIPSTLIALFAVSIPAWYFGLDYVMIKEIPVGAPDLRLDMFTAFSLVELAPYLATALMLALLGTIDSLLTSVVADNLTRTQHKPNQELIGQGIGNSVAALFGGLPGAGATIRTVVNIQAGGRTKLSGMVAGTLLFIIMLFLGPIASKIPAAVLAGILITVGFGVMDLKGLRSLPKMEASEKVVLVTVLLLTVFWQLVYAVGVGLVLAALLFLKRMSDFSARRVIVRNMHSTLEDENLWADEMQIPQEIKEKVVFKHMEGPMFFGIVDHFRSVVAEFEGLHILVIRMEKVPFMDQSGLIAMERAVQEMNEQGMIVVLVGADQQIQGRLRQMKVVPQTLPEKYVFRDLSACRDWLKAVLGTEGALEEELAALGKAK